MFARTKAMVARAVEGGRFTLSWSPKILQLPVTSYLGQQSNA